MSRIKHHAIVVTSRKKKSILKSWEKALALFNPINTEDDSIVSEIIVSVKNRYYSFFISPDGGKEDRNTSDEHDYKREEFCEWLRTKKNIDFVEVGYGGDSDERYILNTN